ncbi:CoA transferase [Streptomyces sp. NPDC002143]
MLSDVTVVEFGDRLSTAYCGKLLVDAGAAVIKVEQPTGDPLRETNPAYAAYLHAGKKSVTAHDNATFAQALARLGPGVDVLVCDSAEDAERAATLRGHMPELIVVVVSDYGLTGPNAGTPATELTLQVEAGIAVLHDTGTRPPVMTGVPLAELAAGLAAAVGALQALLARDTGATGIQADISRFESLIGLLQYPWHYDAIDGHAPYLLPKHPASSGGAVRGLPPYVLPANPVPSIEPALDGWVCIVTMTPDQWTGFKKMAGIPELDDARFDAVTDRALYGPSIAELVRPFTSRHTIDQLVELGVRHRVPITPVGVPMTLATLPPYADRQLFVRNDIGGFDQPRPPFRLSFEAGPWVPGPLPKVGEHNGLVIGTAASRLPPLSDTADARYPLRGLRVLEFGLFQAGPLVTTQLAALGADVIKVEAVMRPDLIRFAGVPPTAPQAWERSASFLTPNLGKRAITVDLADPRGIEIVQKLLATCDIILENYAPRTLDRRGLDFDGVRALRPDVIMVRMPAWGLDSTWSDRPGFTFTADAMSGMAELTGYESGAPRTTGTTVDPLAAMIGVFATLAAVRRRRRTGEGGLIELALCDVAPQFSAEAAVTASATGEARVRTANQIPSVAIQGVYRCKDQRWIGVSIGTDEQWRSFAAVPGVGAWAGDKDLESSRGRSRRRDELDARVAEFCSSMECDALVADLRGAAVPAAPLQVGTDFVVHPQLIARGRVFDVTHPVTGTMPFVGPAARMSYAPDATAVGCAPLFGQHNTEVLTELGYGAEDIEALSADKIIGNAPYGLPLVKGASQR